MRVLRVAWAPGVLMTLVCIMLAGCQISDALVAVTPTLPGTLIVVASAESNAPASVYVSGEGFRRLPVEDSARANRQRDDYQPANVSPDGKWRIGLSRDQAHFAVLSTERDFDIPNELAFTRGYAWSPDSRYFAFAGDDREGAWIGHVFVLDVQTGAITWIGEGIMPIWTN